MAENGGKWPRGRTKAQLKRETRLREILKLSTVNNLSTLEIAKRHKDERGWSTRSIDRDLSSPEMAEHKQRLREKRLDYADQLLPLQVDDIEKAEKPETRMHFRGQLIGQLLPRTVESKVTGELKQDLTVKGNVTADQLAEVIPVILDMVMAEQVRRADEEGAGDPGKPVDTDKPNP